MSLRGLGRHQVPAIDTAALEAARHADLLVTAARELGNARWEAYLAPLPELLRDAPAADLRAVARRARAAFGAKDSVAEALPWEAAMAFREAIDSLLRVLARDEAARG